MNKKRKIIILISLFLFILLAILINITDTNIIDDKIYSLISSKLINDNITPIIKIITKLSNSLFLIILSIILFIIIRNKKINILIFINAISVFIINNLLKLIFRRDRPSIYNIITEKGYSFPSGHSMISCAYYGLLIYLINKYINNKPIKYILIFINIIIIISIGISRIYLGVHYTTDVLGGHLFGLLYLLIFINYTEHYLEKKDK